MKTEAPTAEQRRAYASWMASQRKLEVRPCAHCGQPFEGIKKRAYCSLICRVAAYRARRAASAPSDAP